VNLNRIVALGAVETRLLFRNRTVAVSSVLVPLLMGLFFMWNLTGYGDHPQLYATAVALQLAVVAGMTVYGTATLIVVARRHTRVLKRMRTSGISDAGLLVATIAPGVLVGLVQLLVFLAVDIAMGVPAVVDPLALVLAVLGGLALAITAALATTAVTASPERAQITTLPLIFIMLGAAIALVVVPTDGWWQALVVLPGGAVGQLTEISLVGGGWTAGLGGLPVLLPALVVTIAWPVVFALLARRSFRWDPRT
jgi:ABC-2 type transport system permease protein